jgi:hypothetical protein
MIGGPADGRRVSGKVTPQRVVQDYFSVFPPDYSTNAAVKYDRHIYVAEVLRAGDEVFHFYRHERLTVPMALAMLLQGYNP